MAGMLHHNSLPLSCLSLLSTTVALKFELHEEFPAMPEFSMFDVPAIFPDDEAHLPDSNGENSVHVHRPPMFTPFSPFELFLQLGHEKVVSIAE